MLHLSNEWIIIIAAIESGNPLVVLLPISPYCHMHKHINTHARTDNDAGKDTDTDSHRHRHRQTHKNKNTYEQKKHVYLVVSGDLHLYFFENLTTYLMHCWMSPRCYLNAINNPNPCLKASLIHRMLQSRRFVLFCFVYSLSRYHRCGEHERYHKI